MTGVRLGFGGRVRRLVLGVAVGAVVLGLGVSGARGALLLNDSWADGSRAESNLPTESAVWAGVSGTSVPPSSVVTSTGKLTLNQGSSSSKLWTYFTSDLSAPNGLQPHNAVQTLGVGDKLSASMSFVIPSAVTSNATSAGRDFRFGLFFDPSDARIQADVNSDGGGGTNPWTDATGYAVQIPVNSNLANTTNLFQIGKRTTSNTSLLGSTGAYSFAPTGGTPVGAQSNVPYTVQLLLQRISATQLDVTAKWLQGNTLLSSQTVSDLGTSFGGTAIGAGLLPGSQSVYSNFDQMFFRMSSNTEFSQIDFSNFQIDYTPAPEPGSMVLMAAGGVLMASRRRCRA
jgi:hypothetical protein